MYNGPLFSSVSLCFWIHIVAPSFNTNILVLAPVLAVGKLATNVWYTANWLPNEGEISDVEPGYIRGVTCVIYTHKT